MIRVASIPVADTRPLRHAVLRPGQNIEVLIEHEAPDAYAVGALDGHDGLISVGFVAPEGGPGVWRIRGMSTAPEARGQGAGSAVLAALVAHAREHGAARVWCNARIRARTLYERGGFRVSSGAFDIPGIGPHYVMELTLRP